MEYRQHAFRTELLGRETVAAADGPRQRLALAAVKGFRQGGHHVEVKRFGKRAGFFGAIQYGNRAGAFRQRRQQVGGGERAIEADF